jgi:hypothetical protein
MRAADTVTFSPYKCPMPKNSFANNGTPAPNASISVQQLWKRSATRTRPTRQHLRPVNQHCINSKGARQSNRYRAQPRPPPTTNIGQAPSPRVEPAPPPRHRYPLRSHQRANHCEQRRAQPTNRAPHWEEPEQQANAIIDPTTGKSQEYHHLRQGQTTDVWIKSFANELGRLAQGVGTRMPTVTNTVFFIKRNEVPNGRVVTYGRVVCTICPQKEEEHRSRVTIGGNLLTYPGNVSTPTAKITAAKCVINSTISTPGAKFGAGDLKNFNLGTPMSIYEYMRLVHLSIIPQEIINQYNLLELADDNGWVHMYGLKQAGIIANQLLTKHLAKFGYHPTPRTPGLWRHRTRNIAFALVVDDFKYVGKQHADHLLATLNELYTVAMDWTGTLCCGLAIKWNYEQQFVDISMPGYVEAALHKFQHTTPSQPQHAPHRWSQPTYGEKNQYAPDPDNTERLRPKAVTRLQQILGTFLYYAIAVDATMLVALGTLASKQTKATTTTSNDVQHLLDYAATHP